jgi:hypothetical protein
MLRGFKNNLNIQKFIGLIKYFAIVIKPKNTIVLKFSFINIIIFSINICFVYRSQYNVLIGIIISI